MDQSSDVQLGPLCDRISNLLQARGQRFVLAESCTAGLVAATLGRIPGISNWFCGSMVTYRETTKLDWLRVSSAILSEYTAESAQASRELANRVLSATPEAQLSIAVTGHLGPNAPPDKDGIIYVALACRESTDPIPDTPISQADSEPYYGRDFVYHLEAEARIDRQAESVWYVLSVLMELLQG